MCLKSRHCSEVKYFCLVCVLYFHVLLQGLGFFPLKEAFRISWQRLFFSFFCELSPIRRQAEVVTCGIQAAFTTWLIISAYCFCLFVSVLHLEIIALWGWYYTHMTPLLLRRCLGPQIRESWNVVFFHHSEFLYPSLPYYFVTGRRWLSQYGLAVLGFLLFFIFSWSPSGRFLSTIAYSYWQFMVFFHSFNYFMS